MTIEIKQSKKIFLFSLYNFALGLSVGTLLFFVVVFPTIFTMEELFPYEIPFLVTLSFIAVILLGCLVVIIIKMDQVAIRQGIDTAIKLKSERIALNNTEQTGDEQNE